MRDRLIELLKGNLPYHTNEVVFWQDEHIGALADYLIANGVTVNEWRPASEPPKEEGSYLVYSCKSKTVFTARYRPRSNRWANRANGQFITHWQPLPQPPKEVE